jgi:predicted negative regulator of RcsB-dependent stress response
MFAKGRLERKVHEIRPWWATAAEWVCWIMIAALIFYIAWSRMS